MSAVPRSESGSSVPYVRGPREDGHEDDVLLGGKGATLRALIREGFPVPPFFCVTTRLLREIRSRREEELSAEFGRLARMESGDPGLAPAARELSERVRGWLREDGLGGPPRDAIEAAFDRWLEPGRPVAVRSSVVGEDSEEHSFAGQMDTHLFVGREELVDRILDCLASAFSERALLYRHARSQLDRAIDAGVVVQEMVPAERSGVTFTVDPVTGDPGDLVVAAGFGLGEGVVGDLVETDTYRVGKADRTVRSREIATKEHRVVRDPGRGGTRVERLPRNLRQRPVLAEPELERVVELALRLEAWSSAPCDVEWSIGPDGDLRLLQSRPVTALSEARLTILDNANIVESYPGISSPLTFSFVRQGYAETFRAAMRVFGVSEATLDGERILFQNLVALADGRIYYNILHWYRLYELLGLEGAIPAWERALGLSRKVRPVSRSRGPGLWRTAYIRAKLVVNLFTRHRRITAYLDDLGAQEARIRALDLEGLSPHELLELFEDLADRLLAPYGIAVVNDLYAQQLYGLVGRLLERWGFADPDALRNALVVGGAPSDSIRALRSLTGLAEEIRGDPRWRGVFEEVSDPEEIRRELVDREDLEELRERVDGHLARYGDRTIQELKLETPSLREEPGFALGLLRDYVLQPPTDVDVDPGDARRDAEGRIRERLRGHPMRRAALSRLLGWTREAIRQRENMRLARTRAFGLVKRVFRAIAARFADAGILENAPDIFFLTVDEIKGAIRGHSVHRDLRRLVALRREEYARHEEVEPPSRIVARGPLQARASAGPPGSRIGASGKELRGQGCSRGVARGPAAVIRDPRSAGDVRGKILVAPMTDPGWIFLMVGARGLVVEKGSTLSHTAIVGRELGIPTVVGVRDATRLIGDGDLVEIDGESGAVRIVARSEEDPGPPHVGSAAPRTG